MRRFAIPLLVAGLLSIVAAYVLVLAGASAIAPWWMALGSSAVLTAIAALGAARHGRATPLLDAATLLSGLCLLIGLAVPLALPAPTAGSYLLLGLPLPTTILLVFAGFLPLVQLPAAYAAAFRIEVLSDDDLARFTAGSRERDTGAAR